MALSRVTTWSAGQVLTAAALNAEYDNILNNALSLISPLTGNLDANTKQITNLLLEKRASAATAGNEARIYYRTDVDQVQVDNGTNICTIPTPVATVTKGDIIGATATTTWGVLNVGPNGYSLTADSSQTTGHKWNDIGGIVRWRVFN